MLTNNELTALTRPRMSSGVLSCSSVSRITTLIESAAPMTASAPHAFATVVSQAPFFWRPLAWWMDARSRAMHAAVREAADATGARYVNLYKPRAEDPFAQRPQELHARDGLHPSDAGYALWLRELDAQAGLSRTLAAASAQRPQS